MIHREENLKNIINNFSKIREDNVSMKQEHNARAKNHSENTLKKGDL